MDLHSMLNPGLSPESIANLNPMLRTALQNMVAAAPTDVRSGLRINSGYRSVDRQRELYEAALKKYGNEAAARRWVAPPGSSQHNHGKAVDLGYLSPRAKAWVHENAKNFGLHFPMAHEPWHIEMIGGRDGKGQPVMVANNVAGVSAAGANVTGASPSTTSETVGNDAFDLGSLMGGMGGMAPIAPMSMTQGPKIVRGKLDPTIYQNV